MSLDKLAIIFIIIILPISIMLNAYTDFQSKTLDLQLSYDNKLYNATADTVKAYQLNAYNEDTSNLSASKMRNIEACANTFLNAVTNNFNMNGYSKEELQEYIPALVFTTYDGYYVYSKLTNTLTENEYSEGSPSEGILPSTYQNGQSLYGVLPFIGYSCEYALNGDNFVISYTLDNYISIQGTIGGNWVNDAGYLIDISKIEDVNTEDKTLKYRGIEIGPESILYEYVGPKKYKYQKINGVKYYYDNERDKWFSLINGVRSYTNNKYEDTMDYSAFNYYHQAYKFTTRLKRMYNIDYLRPINAKGVVESYSGRINIYDYLDQSETSKYQSIFGNTFAEGIEEPGSNFNIHRLAVIKYSIEKNLSVAIKNYNRYSNGTYSNFQMPRLNETEWDKIMNSTTVISFLQGLPIGGKVYNGCCVVANNKSEELVREDSIYLVQKSIDGGNTYYSPFYVIYNKDYVKQPGEHLDTNLMGIFDIDLERRSTDTGDMSVKADLYYPKFYLADYDSVVHPIKKVNLNASETTSDGYNYAYKGNVYKYMEEKVDKNIAKAYFTALGRERNSTYKVNKPLMVEEEETADVIVGERRRVDKISVLLFLCNFFYLF